MRAYDPKKPLYFCHIPRTGGVVTRIQLVEMLGQQNVLHGHNPQPGPGQVGTAHYDASVGWGLVDLQPDAEQFMTIMRDPFKRQVSRYFNLKNHWGGEARWKPSPGCAIRLSDYGSTLRGWLERYPADVSRFLPIGSNHVRPLPEMLEDFVLVGLDVAMREFLHCLAKMFDKPVPAFRFGNPCGPRDEPVTEQMRRDFVRAHKEDYELYHYAITKWKPILEMIARA